VISPCLQVIFERMRTPPTRFGVARTHEFLPGSREYGWIGKWEEYGAGRKARLSGAASQRSMPQLECDQQPLSIVLAEEIAIFRRALGNSYDVRHGSYPR
jgi:hypothetical protein